MTGTKAQHKLLPATIQNLKQKFRQPADRQTSQTKLRTAAEPRLMQREVKQPTAKKAPKVLGKMVLKLSCRSNIPPRQVNCDSGIP